MAFGQLFIEIKENDIRRILMDPFAKTYSIKKIIDEHNMKF